MAFHAATLLSRTTGGDAELAKPANGLSLGQRKLLTFLEQPQALEELADEHALDRAKLERDLAKLASLSLIAIDGQHPLGAATGVVLGGLRAPSMLRWLLPLLLLVCAAIVYYAMRSPAMRKPLDAPVSISAAPGPQRAPVIAAGSVVDAPDAMPPSVPAIAAATPKALVGDAAQAAIAVTSLQDRATDSAARAAVAAPAGASAAEASRTSTRGDVPLTGAVVAPAPFSVRNALPAPASAPTSRVALPVALANVSATSDDAIAVPQQPSPRTAATAGAPPAKAAASDAANVVVAPAARAATLTAEAPAPVKLAMAAPSTTVAHPPAAARLLPLTRRDPDFPREAIARGVATGTVTARLAIDAAGHVSAVSIVDARPSRVFDRVVTEALSHWTFPAGDGGRSTEVEIAFHRD